jgi:hypothetical protein
MKLQIYLLAIGTEGTADEEFCYIYIWPLGSKDSGLYEHAMINENVFQKQYCSTSYNNGFFCFSRSWATRCVWS